MLFCGASRCFARRTCSKHQGIFPDPVSFCRDKRCSMFFLHLGLTSTLSTNKACLKTEELQVGTADSTARPTLANTCANLLLIRANRLILRIFAFHNRMPDM